MKSAESAMVDKSPKIPQIYSWLPKGIENWKFLAGMRLGNFGRGQIAIIAIIAIIVAIILTAGRRA